MTEGFQMKDREKWRNEHSKKELEITVDHKLKISRQHKGVLLEKKHSMGFQWQESIVTICS